MKKYLFVLFFLGITSTGFAQSVEKKGLAISYNEVSDTRIEIGCLGFYETCFKITPSYIYPDKHLLTVPQFAISKYVLDPKVNGASVNSLPSELPDEDGDFIIEFEPDDTEVTE